MLCRSEKQFWPVLVRYDCPGNDSTDFSPGNDVGRRRRAQTDVVLFLGPNSQEGAFLPAQGGTVLPANPLRGCNRSDPVDNSELISARNGYEH